MNETHIQQNGRDVGLSPRSPAYSFHFQRKPFSGLAVCPFPWTCYLEVVVSGAVVAAFAPRAEVERDAQLVVPPASAPELEQVLAHSVALVALQVLVCPLDDSAAVQWAASLVDRLDAPPELVAPLVVRSAVSPDDQPAYPQNDSLAVHLVASLVDPLDALLEPVAPLVVHSVALQAAVRLDALLADPQGGPLADYSAVRLEDDHWSQAAASYSAAVAHR